jgi:signal transduction histidine kinase
MATIACVELDPLLVDLVRRVRPGDDVVEVPPEELLAGRPARWGAVVAPADSLAAQLVDGTPLAARTVLIGAAGSSHPGPALRRPVDGQDLRFALSSLLRPPGRRAAVRWALRELPQTVGAPGLFVVARAMAVTAAVALAAAGIGGIGQLWVVAIVFSWALLRTAIRGLTVGLVTFDLVVALFVLLVTGGGLSPYVLVAAVVAGEVGYVYPRRTGALVVGLGVLAGVVQLTGYVLDGRAQPSDIFSFGALVPLASVAGVLGAHISRSREAGHLRTLRQLNNTLERLSRQAHDMAGSLSTLTVTEAVLDTAREEFGATAAILMLDEGEPTPVRLVAGSFGLTSPPPQRIVDDGSRGQGVPPEVARLLPEGERLIAHVGSATVQRGCLVVVVPFSQRTRGISRRLADLADEAALALDNARVFEGIRSLTLDEERGRLARDLHDGVVQSLVHVGFELDLLAGQLDDGIRDEAVRLRKVVGQAVDEVRGTVQDLRSTRLADGLGVALDALARDYESSNVAVRADVSPVDGLSPEAELQLLRIAQEAVSNAVQHGAPQRVDVMLWPSDHGVHLQVSDDGTGLGTGSASSTPDRGVGLRAMTERAELLGASLTVEPGAAWGTCVRVDVPWERVRS